MASVPRCRPLVLDLDQNVDCLCISVSRGIQGVGGRRAHKMEQRSYAVGAAIDCGPHRGAGEQKKPVMPYSFVYSFR